nr:LOW QUALITY PROTEIN: neural-cadherin-like [Cherax quadricarinatus]
MQMSNCKFFHSSDAVSAENPHNPHHHHSNHQPLPPPSSPLPSSSSAAPPQQQRLRLQLFHDDENIGGEHVREETAQSPGREKFSLHQRSIRSLEGRRRRWYQNSHHLWHQQLKKDQQLQQHQEPDHQQHEHHHQHEQHQHQHHQHQQEHHQHHQHQHQYRPRQQQPIRLQRSHRNHRLQKRHQILQHQQQHHQHHHRQQRPHMLQFTQSEYRQTVSEDVPLHTSIMTVRATAGQNKGRSDIRYQLSDTTNFGIDEGGVIYNLRPLDFESTNGHYVLHITAEDLEGDRWGRNKAVVTANIQVTDAPEEPYFDSPHYYFSVSEFAPRGSYIGTVRADDDDEDLDYYFLEGVEPPEMFTINSVSGVVSSGWPPDGTQWLYTFKAGAIDHRGHVTLVPVTVHIIASSPSYARLVWVTNDNKKPEFSECEAYDGIHVNENVTAGTPVLLVHATDQDSGREGALTYTLINDFGSFAIHASNQHGQVTTTRRLDRDGEDKEFFLTVIAKDGGVEPLQAACSFRVIVDDVNDNPPIFDQPRYEQSLATDHLPSSPVLRVTSSDLDSGINAQVTYHLEGLPEYLEYFTLEPITGVLSLKRPLDGAMVSVEEEGWEVGQSLGVKDVKEIVRVSQWTAVTPSLWTTVPVSVHSVFLGVRIDTLRVKQSAATENLEKYHREHEVACFVVPGERVAKDTRDTRSNLPDNPNVYFTLLNGNTRDANSDGTFAIRRLPEGRGACGDTAGVTIFVATRNLDFESVQAYKLNLQIVNDRNARQEKQVVVDIVDVNDNAPLLQPFDGAVLENTDSTLITTIQALDKDASPRFRQLTYSFDATASPDVMTKFTLKPNGELWTTKPLDREEEKQYRIPIQVTDGVAEHERMTIYWITVQDLNDVPPELDAALGVYEVQLPENREVGKPTGIHLMVTDPDIVNHFTYQIVEGNDERKFRIDSSTGDVLVNKPLDYDHPVVDRNFTMRVRVSDGNNAPAEADITIAVANVNDLQPVFEKANYTFTVTENTDCSIILGKVSALDPDLPPTANQNILYYLSPAELGKFFQINDRSGQLTMKGCLDREAALRGTMTLYPRANDEGGKGHDADPATVQVIINDLNDNYPHFIKPEQSYARILENLEPSLLEPVIIELGDLDSEMNGCPCSLEFHAHTPKHIRDKFSLTPMEKSRYRLSPVTVLDREQRKVYRLPFTARDTRGLAGTRYLTLEVADENDSPMTDGESTIKVYNYQGQFPAMVIGSVYVSDEDDHDRQDKTFEVDASTSPEVAARFKVDLYTGNITMVKGTSAGTHVLRVKVHDNFRREMAIGQTTINVVDLTLSAVMQSGSLRLANTTTHNMLQQRQPGATGTSLYERLKKQIARIHDISDSQVDVFALKDVGSEGVGAGVGVEVRYNCHGSPYYTAARLDGVMLRRRRQVSEALGVDISMVDINACLYEATSPCGVKSCQHTMRPNLTSPLVVSSSTATVVGVDIADDYACDCGALEPLPSVCFPGFCFNGGTCFVRNNTLTCSCLDGTNYGPRCELLTARFERGFAWFEPLTVCDHSSLSVTFETNDDSGVLLYTGPTVLSPWPDYPPDFLYVVIHCWTVETFLDLGTGTINVSIPIEPNMDRAFEYIITWNEGGVTVEVIDCGINATLDSSEPCKKTVPLAGLSNSPPSHLLNVQGPLQIGGVAAMVSFPQLAASYGWTQTPPAVYPFSGCILEVRHNDHLYDLNATDFSKQTFQPCDAPRTSRVVLGQQSIIIILASLLCLLLLVVVILCLARRGKKTISYPDLDRELVKETMGDTDVEGFGEKDVTHFDLKFLQVTPDGYLVNDEDNEAGLPDVAQDACQRLAAPLAQMPEGLSVGDFIKENILKVDQCHQDVDDVRHYNVQGDEMSAASLSSLASGSSRSDGLFDYRSDWGQRFEKLAQIYAPESDAEEDSEYEFPDIPSKPREEHHLLLRPESAKTTKNDLQLTSSKNVRKENESPVPSAAGESNIGSPAPDGRAKNAEAPTQVSASKNLTESAGASPTSKVKNYSSTLTLPNGKKTDSPPSPSNQKHKVDPPSPILATKQKLDVPSPHPSRKKEGDANPPASPLANRQNPVSSPSSPLANKLRTEPPSPLTNKLRIESPSSHLSSRYISDSSVTTISNLYKSPAQRSLESNRYMTLPTSSSKLPKEGATTDSNTATATLRSKNSEQKAGGQTVMVPKSKDYHDRVKANSTASVLPVKGIETWC